MLILILINSLVPVAALALDWLYPRLHDRARETFEDWWLRFADLDYRTVGPFMAALVTRRLDQSLGVRSFGWRFLLSTLLLSQALFLIILLTVATAQGLAHLGEPAGVVQLLKQIVQRLGHGLVPLLVINTLGDMISILATRAILRRAAEARGLLVFATLMGLDLALALCLAALTLFTFGHFFFAASFLHSLAAFMIGSSLLYVVVAIAVLGVYMLFTGYQHEKKPVRSLLGMLGTFFLLESAFCAYAIVEHRPYAELLDFAFDDLAFVLVLTVSTTAVLPTLLGLLLLVLLLAVNTFSRQLHRLLAHLLLRMAETPRGILPLGAAVLQVLGNAMIYLVTKR